MGYAAQTLRAASSFEGWTVDETSFEEWTWDNSVLPCTHFFPTILQTTTGTYCTLGGCATPEDQSPTVALLWAFGERLSGLLKEPFTHAGRQLRPEGDELLKIGIDCAQFCAAYVVLLRRALW